MRPDTLSLDRTEPVTLNAVILYEDYPSGCWAKAFFDRLRSRCQGAARFSLALWRANLLLLPGGFGMALRDFGCADLLTLALRTEGLLPGPLADWVESWIQCRAGPNAAVIVLQPHPPKAGTPLSTSADRFCTLRRLAEQHGLAFFRENAVEPSRESQDYVEHLRQREQAMTLALRSILTRGRVDNSESAQPVSIQSTALGGSLATTHISTQLDSNFG